MVDLFSGEKTKVTNMNNRDDGLSLSALDLISINAAYVTHLITQSGSVVDFCQMLRNRLFRHTKLLKSFILKNMQNRHFLEKECNPFSAYCVKVALL